MITQPIYKKKKIIILIFSLIKKIKIKSLDINPAEKTIPIKFKHGIKNKIFDKKFNV